MGVSAETKMLVNENHMVVKDISMTIGLLLTTKKWSLNSRIVVVVVLELATTPCVVVINITTK
jgi:hypothetical protein